MKFHLSIVCSIILLFVINTSQAVPTRSFQLLEKSSWTEMSRQQMEQQLGRKMTLKERAAFWLAKKRAKAKKGLSKSEKILFTVLLILFLILIIFAIWIDSIFSRRDGTPRRKGPFVLLALDIGLLYFVLNRPTRKKVTEPEKKSFKDF